MADEVVNLNGLSNNTNNDQTRILSKVDLGIDVDESDLPITSDDSSNCTTNTTDTLNSDKTTKDNLIASISNVITEMKGGVEDEAYVCNYCTYQTASKMLYQRHVKIHNIDKPFKCPHCEREFRDSLQLSNHVNIHLGLKPYGCDYCELSFTTQGEKVRHTRYKHTGEKPHKCPECDYASVELSKLKRHIRTHTGERPYLCPHCDYASRDTFKLKRHIRVHTGEKPYVCPVCNRAFAQSNSLKNHLATHREAEIYLHCNFCPMKFNRKIELDQHNEMFHKDCTNAKIPISRHYKPDAIMLANLNQTSKLKNTKPIEINFQLPEINDLEFWYHCSDCTMKFATKQALCSHQIKHTGERPYKCHICGISFAQTFALRAHIASHKRSNSVISSAANVYINKEQDEDERIIMNTLEELVDNVVQIVNPTENDELINENVQYIVNSMLNNMIDDVVVILETPSKQKAKRTGIAKLLSDDVIPKDELKNRFIPKKSNLGSLLHRNEKCLGDTQRILEYLNNVTGGAASNPNEAPKIVTARLPITLDLSNALNMKIITPVVSTKKPSSMLKLLNGDTPSVVTRVEEAKVVEKNDNVEADTFKTVISENKEECSNEKKQDVDSSKENEAKNDSTANDEDVIIINNHNKENVQVENTKTSNENEDVILIDDDKNKSVSDKPDDLLKILEAKSLTTTAGAPKETEIKSTSPTESTKNIIGFINSIDEAMKTTEKIKKPKKQKKTEAAVANNATNDPKIDFKTKIFDSLESGINCLICSKKFQNKPSLIRHLKAQHEYEDPKTVNQDKYSHDSFLSHLNTTALGQNYTGISKTSKDIIKNTTSAKTVVKPNTETATTTNLTFMTPPKKPIKKILKVESEDSIIGTSNPSSMESSPTKGNYDSSFTDNDKSLTCSSVFTTPNTTGTSAANTTANSFQHSASKKLNKDDDVKLLIKDEENETFDNDEDSDGVNISNTLDQALQQSRNESYSELVQHIIVQNRAQKKPKTTTRRAPVKVLTPQQEEMNLIKSIKSASHLAPDPNAPVIEVKKTPQKSRAKQTPVMKNDVKKEEIEKPVVEIKTALSRGKPKLKEIVSNGKSNGISHLNDLLIKNDIATLNNESKARPTRKRNAKQRDIDEGYENNEYIKPTKNGANGNQEEENQTTTTTTTRRGSRGASKRAKLNISSILYDSSPDDA